MKAETEIKKAVRKPYRVTLRSEVLIEVDVYATTVDEARAKAFSCSFVGGVNSCTIGHYFLGEDFRFDDGEMYWEIVAAGGNTDVIETEIVDVVELEEDPDGVAHDEVGE